MMLIRGKRLSARVSAIPPMLGLIVLVSVVMTVGLAVVSAGYILRRMRRKSEKERTPLDWYTIPGPPPNLDAGPNESALAPVGLSIWKRRIPA